MFETILERLRKRIGDTAVVVLLIVGFVVTIVWFLYTFVLGQNESSRVVYYGRMLATCEDISRAAGRIATAGPDDDFQEALSTFQTMKYGQLRLFESKRLERAMVAFRGRLDKSTPELNNVISVESVRRMQLNDRVGFGLGALEIGEACRDMIQPSLSDQLWALLFRSPPDNGVGATVNQRTPESSH